MKNQYFDLAANEEQGRATFANYVYCVSATGAIQVRVGGVAHVDLVSGQGFSLPNTFEAFTVIDKSGAPNAVNLLCGAGKFDNGNLSGSVSATVVQGTALTQFAVTVSPAATALSSLDPTRKFLMIQNNAAATIYLGGAGVTVASGLALPAGGVLTIDQAAAAPWYAIVAAGTADTRIISGV